MTSTRRALVRGLLLGVGLALSVSCSARRHGGGDAVPAPDAGLVAFEEPESMVRLSRSRHRVDFFHLANQFEGQTTRTFCGPATAAIVLNTVRARNDRIEKPVDPSLLPPDVAGQSARTNLLYPRYTQQNLFDVRTEAVKTRREVLGQPRAPGAKPDPGLQLRQLHAMLQAEGLDSRLRVADAALTDDTIRAELVENLGHADDYVIVNYYRPALGQEGGGGHISPLGAYDEQSDSFLILDVNPNGRRWLWAPAAALIRAMRTFDAVENRGYLLVREGHP